MGRFHRISTQRFTYTHDTERGGWCVDGANLLVTANDFSGWQRNPNHYANCAAVGYFKAHDGNWFIVFKPKAECVFYGVHVTARDFQALQYNPYVVLREIDYPQKFPELAEIVDQNVNQTFLAQEHWEQWPADVTVQPLSVSGLHPSPFPQAGEEIVAGNLKAPPAARKDSEETQEVQVSREVVAEGGIEAPDTKGSRETDCEDGSRNANESVAAQNKESSPLATPQLPMGGKEYRSQDLASCNAIIDRWRIVAFALVASLIGACLGGSMMLLAVEGQLGNRIQERVTAVVSKQFTEQTLEARINQNIRHALACGEHGCDKLEKQASDALKEPVLKESIIEQNQHTNKTENDNSTNTYKTIDLTQDDKPIRAIQALIGVTSDGKFGENSYRTFTNYIKDNKTINFVLDYKESKVNVKISFESP